MSTQALSIIPDGGFSVESVRQKRDQIAMLLKDVLREGINADFAAIPGTGEKKTLLKPGAEKICSLFGIAVEPLVEAIQDEEDFTFRVTCRMTAIPSGTYLGSGIGEASTKESKYAWRAAVCDDEWLETDPYQRRRHWKKGFGGKAPDRPILQVREDPNDKRNTVLKMAKKRAMIDGVLTVTAASDIFTQDLEGLIDKNAGKATAPVSGAQVIDAAAPAEPIISQEDSKKFFGIWKNNGRTKEVIQEYLRVHCGGISDDRKMPQRCYTEACRWAKSGEPIPPPPAKPVSAKPAANGVPPEDEATQEQRRNIMELFGILGVDLARQAALLSEFQGRLPELKTLMQSELPPDE